MLKIQSQKLDLDADLYDGEKGELMLPFLNFRLLTLLTLFACFAMRATIQFLCCLLVFINFKS